MTDTPVDPTPKYVVKPAVAILDEHELVDAQGNSTRIDADALQTIADNCNRRVEETGDECPLVIGHTLDDAPETDQPPVVGYARDFFVGDLFRTGKKALFATFKILADKVDVVRNYPRRSVELWLERMEVDPISLLGATTPERDLGLLQLERRGSPKRYSRVYDDATCPTPPCDPVPPSVPEVPENSAPMADEMKPDDAPKGDADKSTLSDADVSKIVAAIMQTDVFKQLEQIIAEEETTPEGADAGHPDDAFPPPGGDPAPTPPGPTPPPPPPVDKERRGDHEESVQYGDLDKVKMQRDTQELKAKLNRTESQVHALQRENEEFKRKYRRSEREKDLRSLVADDGFSFDVAEELDLVTDMSEDVYKVHVDRIKKNYSRAPVRVGLIPTVENPGVFGATSPITKDQMTRAVEIASKGEMSYEQALRKVSGR
jgi:hypothetical protein